MEKTQVEKPRATVKFMKLSTGESIVGLVEMTPESKIKEGIGDYIVYNPYKVTRMLPEASQGSMSGMMKSDLALEEWLPDQIVMEPICTLFSNDIVVMLDVNLQFAKSYQQIVLRKFAIEQLLEKGLPTDKVLENIQAAETEHEEDKNRELRESLEDEILNFRKKFN